MMRPRMVAAMSLCWYAIVALAEDFADDATLPVMRLPWMSPMAVLRADD